MSVLLLGERPSLRPLLPVVLPLRELPVVVELAAGPPDAELPPAVAPAPVPADCANAAAGVASRASDTIRVRDFMSVPCC